MSRVRLLLFCFLLLSLVAPYAMAQADAKPTIAILRFGLLPAVEAVELGVLEVLRANGYIDEAEHALLAEHKDLENDKLSIFWGDANFDLSLAATMVDDALDRGADVLIPMSAPVTLLAINATLDSPMPPTIIFTSVYNPEANGIVDSPCIKPSHVTGIGTATPYSDVLGLLMLHDRTTRVIGTIYNPADSSSVFGSQAINAIGSGYGLTVETAAAATLSDVAIAAEGLVSRGVDAIVLPLDNLTHSALPAIVGVANDNEVLLVSPTSEGAFFGAAIGAGPAPFFRRGVQAAYILDAHLNGEIDVAATGVHNLSARGLALNLDAAAEQGVEFGEQIMDFAGIIIQDGELRMSDEDMNRVDYTEELRVMAEVVLAEGSLRVAQNVLDFVAALPAWDYQTSAAEFLAELACTPEMIAEQQAELDAG